MLRLIDIVSLNHARQKHRSSGKKHIVLLFLVLVQALVLLNVGFGFLERIENYFYDHQYPHDALLIVYHPDPENPDLSRARSINNEQIAALNKLEGVYALQTRFNITSNHFFLIPRVNYLKPESLLGFKQAIFDLYSALPQAQRIPGTIPILLSADMFALGYNGTHFVRSAQADRAQFLGQEIAIILRPMLELEQPRQLSLNPATHIKTLTENLNKAYRKIVQEKPQLQRFYQPVKLRFQVVGYVKARALTGPEPYAFGVIPSTYSEQIQTLLQTRQAGIGKGERRPERVDLMLLLTSEAQQQPIKQQVQQLGLVALDRDDLNRLLLPDIVQELFDQEESKNFILIVLGIIVLFIIFFVYHLLGARVADAWREIGTMRCLGASKKDIRAIFWHLCLRDLTKVMLSAILATNLLLWGLGYWSAHYLNEISVTLVQDLPLIAGFGDFAPGWLTAPLGMQLLLLLVLTPISMLAAVIPVAKASRVDPVVAMKEG